MKTRIISAIVALMICVPLLIVGGSIYNVGVMVIALLSIREFLNAKQVKKELPLFINFITYIIMSLIVATSVKTVDMTFVIDYKIVSALSLVFLIPVILYHDKKIYSITDAFYLIGGVFFLGTSFSLLIIYRNINLLLLVYLALITIMTDTYAYIIGKLIGRHKMLESISPNKTLEGMFFGTLMATIIATVYYILIINNNANIIYVVFMTTFLSVLGQFGDLAFSAIKRYFGIKDFSNIMPGHGGILDRFDSIIFVMLGYIFFM